jgi:hypothetical protein
MDKHVEKQKSPHRHRFLANQPYAISEILSFIQETFSLRPHLKLSTLLLITHFDFFKEHGKLLEDSLRIFFHRLKLKFIHLWLNKI